MLKQTIEIMGQFGGVANQFPLLKGDVKAALKDLARKLMFPEDHEKSTIFQIRSNNSGHFDELFEAFGLKEFWEGL